MDNDVLMAIKLAAGLETVLEDLPENDYVTKAGKLKKAGRVKLAEMIAEGIEPRWMSVKMDVPSAEDIARIILDEVDKVKNTHDRRTHNLQGIDVFGQPSTLNLVIEKGE